MSEALVAADVVFTKHAIDRYMERRGWSMDMASKRREAVAKLEEIIVRVDGKQAPLTRDGQGRCARHISQGELILILSEDYHTLITFYESKPKSMRRSGKNNRRDRSQR